MKLPKSAPVVALLALFGVIACGGEAASGKPGVGNGVAAQLESGYEYCFGQQVQLPACGAVTQSVVATQAYRTNSSDHVYVSYSVEGEGMHLSGEDVDPSVDPSLCRTGDITGICWCEFSGPSTAVALDGTFPI